MVDLNGDGHKDMLSGSFTPGDLYLFAGNSDRSFQAGQILKDKEGKPLNIGQASAVFAADWDQDGDLDLVVGNKKGQVHLFARETNSQEILYASPIPVQAGGKTIDVTACAGPCITDWDGDGKLDLLVGNHRGVVTLFRNTASSGLPQLAEGVILVAEGKASIPADNHGLRSKICVADWNQDGRLDLLLGDFGATKGPVPKITKAQRRERDAAQAAFNEIRMKINAFTSEIRQKYMQEHGIHESQEFSDQQNLDLLQRHNKFMKNNEDCQALVKEKLAKWEILQKYQASSYSRDFVWVFLRSPAGAAVMEADAQVPER